MPKIFKFKNSKQKLQLDKSAFALLSSYQNALETVYAGQNEVKLDLEQSLISKLQSDKVLTKSDIATAIGNLHNLEVNEILSVDNQGQNRPYLNPNRAFLFGVCDLFSRITGINVLLVRIGFLLFYFFSAGFSFLLYIIFAIILPTEEDRQTNFLIKSISMANKDFSENFDQRPQWIKKLNEILNPFSLIFGRFLGIVLTISFSIFAIFETFISSGLIFHKLSLWPDSLAIQTSAYQLETWWFLTVVFLNLTSVLIGWYLLMKLAKSFRLGSISTKNIYRNLSVLTLAALVFVFCQSILNSQDKTLTNKSFTIKDVKNITILNNSFCPAKYVVFVQKSNSNSIQISGDEIKVKTLTVDNLKPGEYTLTNIYPYQNCLKAEMPLVSVIINSDKPFNLEKELFGASDKTFHVIINGFSQNEIVN